jgi:hypothetical protein
MGMILAVAFLNSSGKENPCHTPSILKNIVLLKSNFVT